jgi:hypothetical protein
MRRLFTLALLFLVACPFTLGQAAPAATAGKADLQYSIRYSENAEFGTTLGTWHTIDPSGSLDYTNGHTRLPFTLDYTGGYGYTISGPSYTTGAFQRLLVSQGIKGRKWDAVLSDDVGYRPQAPTTGFSGIPGIGEPIGGLYPPSSQGIMTVQTHVLNNDASGEFQRMFGRGSVFLVDVQDRLLLYPDGNGLDTDQFIASAGPTFRLNARNSLITSYAFSQFAYPDYDYRFQTQTILAGFIRSWNRAFHSTASVGPEFVLKSGSIPASTGVAAQATLEYQLRRFTADVTYNRAVTGGSGYLMGSQSESITGSASRSLTLKSTVEMVGGYRHNSELSTGRDITAEFGSAQATWRIGRYLNFFGNYTATSQSSHYVFPSNVLNQLLQNVAAAVG